MIHAVLPLALFLAGPLSTRPLTVDDLAYEPDAKGQPNEVGQWLLCYDACLHWGGEPGEDPDRLRQIQRGIAENCPGLGRQRRALLRKYARRPLTVKLLRTRSEID